MKENLYLYYKYFFKKKEWIKILKLLIITYKLLVEYKNKFNKIFN